MKVAYSRVGIDVYPEVPHLYPEEGSESDHIQGPWLWMVVPTDPAVGEGISTEIDSLADASEGGITEVDACSKWCECRGCHWTVAMGK